ncbi:hypothetical protein M413DRAFT_445818 [Hebeloma cylindrosporum]|uniref:Uncharacterized protein n=1 Tax=Hebeloma cylindrosporum TaxID=76867 RepID=A0A0C2XTZ0_HEBCY|nr:hypothetical protein M413DRAFT_445818 [Hebeloma cylindrosporum h7]
MAIVALSILGAILRFQAVRRNRARMNVFAVPPIPVYPHNQNGTMPMYLPAMQPPGQFSPSPHYGQRQSWAPRPGFPNPAFSPPQPYPPPPGAAYPSSPYPPAPSSPKFFPNPIPTSPPNPAHSRSGSHSTSPPHPISEKRRTNPSSEQMSLVDRMQEVQTLMLEIHRLESDPGSNNRVRIQELQRRVTELSDTGNSNVATSGQVLGPPPAYAQDGRDPA